MKKIRINVLARELEVKSHLILELLPELGVSEKLTHSSSIDEDVADKLRVHYGLPPIGNGEAHPAAAVEAEPEHPVVEAPARPSPPIRPPIAATARPAAVPAKPLPMAPRP